MVFEFGRVVCAHFVNFSSVSEFPFRQKNIDLRGKPGSDKIPTGGESPLDPWPGLPSLPSSVHCGCPPAEEDRTAPGTYNWKRATEAEAGVRMARGPVIPKKSQRGRNSRKWRPLSIWRFFQLFGDLSGDPGMGRN